MSAIANTGIVQRPTHKRPYVRRHRRSYTTLFLVLSDVIALECALLLGCLLRNALHHWLPIQLGPAQYRALCLAILAVPFGYYWMGLYPGYGLGPVQRLRARVYTTLLVFSTLLAWNYVFVGAKWSRGVMLGTMLSALILAPLFETFTRSLLTRVGLCGMRVIVLSRDRAGHAVVDRLRRNPSLGLIPVAILDDDETTWGDSHCGVPISGGLAMASEYRGDAEGVIISMPDMRRDELLRTVQKLEFQSITVVPDLAGVQTLWTVSRDLAGILGIELRKNLLLKSNRVVKRALDYAIAIPACVVALPILAICSIAIRLSSRGPAFYSQEREGEGGRPIRVWKLRTMHVDADRILDEYLDAHPDQRRIWHTFYKLKKDPRILLGIGTFLRATSLDELPQLWNILKGDMSLVGPRPFPDYHLSSFPTDFRDLRRSVAPGLTGLWQVSERSDGDLSVQESLDTYYIRNWSVWLDVYILARTVRTVIKPKGAY